MRRRGACRRRRATSDRNLRRSGGRALACRRWRTASCSRASSLAARNAEDPFAIARPGCSRACGCASSRASGCACARARTQHSSRVGNRDRHVGRARRGTRGPRVAESGGPLGDDVGVHLQAGVELGADPREVGPGNRGIEHQRIGLRRLPNEAPGDRFVGPGHRCVGTAGRADEHRGCIDRARIERRGESDLDRGVVWDLGKGGASRMWRARSHPRRQRGGERNLERRGRALLEGGRDRERRDPRHRILAERQSHLSAGGVDLEQREPGRLADDHVAQRLDGDRLPRGPIDRLDIHQTPVMEGSADRGR